MIFVCFIAATIMPLMVQIAEAETGITDVEQCFTTEIYQPYEVPSDIDTSMKAWMDYRTITDKTSVQWELQQMATTDENGLRRLDGKYMVAVGTYYSALCGESLIIVLEDGSFIEAVVGDIKQDIHTDQTNRYTPINEAQGNVVEFIVDTDCLLDQALLLGDVSVAGIEGNIKEILKEIGMSVCVGQIQKSNFEVTYATD